MSLKHQTHHTLLFDRVKITVLFIIVCIVAVSAFNMVRSYIAAKKITHDILQNKDNLENKMIDLRTNQSLINTDIGKETLLRERYGYVRPGEGVVIITSSGNKEESHIGSIMDDKKTTTQTNFWSKIRSFFTSSK